MAIRYSTLYDSLYDDEKLIWVEERCSDPSCEFCAYRPDKPEKDKRDKIMERKELSRD